MEVANVPTLSDLQDMETFECKRAIPVLRAHRRWVLDRFGQNTDKLKYEVTDGDLDEICAHSNAQVTRDCHFPRYTIGHINLKPNSVEANQPAKLIGHAVNYRVGVMPNGEKVILADCYTRKSMCEEADGFPYRSAEYNWRTKKITGVARLLKDPALGLGTEVYEDEGSTTCYAEAVMADENDDKPKAKEGENKPPKEGEGEGKGKEGKEGEEEKPAEQAKPLKKESDLNPDEAVMADRILTYFACKYPGFEALMATASGTNTGLPGTDQRPDPAPDGEGDKAKVTPDDDDEDDDDDDGSDSGSGSKKTQPNEDDEEETMSKNAATTVDVAQYEATKAEVETLRAENAALKDKENKASVREIVDNLVNVEKYELDADDQAALAEELLPLDKAGRDKKVAFVKKNCRKVAGHDTVQVLEGNAGTEQVAASGATKAMDPAHYQRAIKLTKEQGVDWAVAVEKTKK